MFGIVRNGEIKRAIDEALDKARSEFIGSMQKDVNQRLKRLTSIEALQDETLRLREQIETLKIEKDRKDEEFDRREREVEHKVGLERKRQEVESAAAKREAKLEVREENLDSDRKRFEEQMEFERERLEKQVDSLNSLVGKLLERLPSAEIIGRFSNSRGGDDGE